MSNIKSTSIGAIQTLLPALIFSLCSYALPNAAKAQEAVDLSCPSEGTSIQYVFTNSDKKGSTFRSTFNGMDGKKCNYKIGDSARSRYAMFCAAGSDCERNNRLDTFWPLKVGNKASWYYSDYTNSFAATAEETLDTKAGQFKTIKVVSEAANKDGFKSQATYWYAPSVGFYVKYEYKVLAGYDKSPAPDFEVVAVKSK